MYLYSSPVGRLRITSKFAYFKIKIAFYTFKIGSIHSTNIQLWCKITIIWENRKPLGNSCLRIYDDMDFVSMCIAAVLNDDIALNTSSRCRIRVSNTGLGCRIRVLGCRIQINILEFFVICIIQLVVFEEVHNPRSGIEASSSCTVCCSLMGQWCSSSLDSKTNVLNILIRINASSNVGLFIARRRNVDPLARRLVRETDSAVLLLMIRHSMQLVLFQFIHFLPEKTKRR